MKPKRQRRRFATGVQRVDALLLFLSSDKAFVASPRRWCPHHKGYLCRINLRAYAQLMRMCQPRWFLQPVCWPEIVPSVAGRPLLASQTHTNPFQAESKHEKSAMSGRFWCARCKEAPTLFDPLMIGGGRESPPRS